MLISLCIAERCENYSHNGEIFLSIFDHNTEKKIKYYDVKWFQIKQREKPVTVYAGFQRYLSSSNSSVTFEFANMPNSLGMLVHILEFDCIHKPRAIYMKLLIRQSRSGFNYKISFPDLSRVYNMVRVIEGKIVQKCSEGKQKLLRVSGSVLTLQ